ncbi:DUF3168 domain-containing protein [Mesorhizobium sp. NBSH29]|uniref:tail completion protein gp17 n=1 Tax=Mesorhizobium sp. NBSH29 TaxID=2654249 RepID=UPI001896A49C|nr:DUF3168 domain-containing protein [Mesorhizobium sp. NBSH29]QPC87415.1 DUF3168 domain-containing protein [Mesorhizobium sp. NBSH29]
MEILLTTLLAPVAGGNRYWVRAPQGQKPPYVIMQRITGIRDYHLQGASGLVESRVQIDCYDKAYSSVASMARSVVSILSGHRAGIIQGIFIDSERDLPAADAGDVTSLFRKSIDIIIQHKEA